MSVQRTARHRVIHKLPPQAAGAAQQKAKKNAAAAGYSGKSSFAAAGAAPGVDLQRGSQGANVQALQSALVKLGYMTQAQMNTGPGIFGPQTEAAVKHFQRDHGVPQTGYYGPLTRQALNSALQQGGSTQQPPSTTGGGTTQQPPSTGASADVQKIIDQHPQGSYGGQCSGFVAAVEGVPGFPRSDGLGPVNGNQMVDYLCNSQGFHRVSTPQAGDVFSMNTGQYGHTGIVVGVNGNMVQVIDSNWHLDEKVQVHEIPLSSFSGFARKS